MDFYYKLKINDCETDFIKVDNNFFIEDDLLIQFLCSNKEYEKTDLIYKKAILKSKEMKIYSIECFSYLKENKIKHDEYRFFLNAVCKNKIDLCKYIYYTNENKIENSVLSIAMLIARKMKYNEMVEWLWNEKVDVNYNIDVAFEILCNTDCLNVARILSENCDINLSPLSMESIYNSSLYRTSIKIIDYLLGRENNIDDMYRELHLLYPNLCKYTEFYIVDYKRTPKSYMTFLLKCLLKSYPLSLKTCIRYSLNKNIPSDILLPLIVNSL